MAKKASEKTVINKPVWGGPCEEGITQSMIGKFLTCKERFRVLVVEGLKPNDKWNHYIEFGSMWHVCEEYHARDDNWRLALEDYCEKLCAKYPFQQDKIDKWYGICLTQFPLYVDFWKPHADMQNRTPLLQEEVFNVPYKLPSGRVVKLRGKWDSVDVVGDGIWLQENKTKSDIDVVGIQRQLLFDLQTQMYSIALLHSEQIVSMPHEYKGVRYNVIRRPRQYQGKKEDRTEFHTRLAGIISEAPYEFFYRWNVPITPSDIERFKKKCFNPLLESICIWWDHMTCVPWTAWHGDNVHSTFHYQHPYGVYNSVDNGGTNEVDEYLMSGSTEGLVKVETLFPELVPEGK